MASYMAKKFQEERAAIIEIRKQNPTIGAYALASRIWDGEIGANLGANLGGRTKLSTLSVIRRFDAKVKSAVSTALAGTVQTV